MLKYLGVSRSGYRSWLNRTPSDTEKRREYIKAKIQDIYDQSKQNYGAPKITRELRQKGETISERTVGKYMKEMGIKAQWVKPWTITTIDSDFSNELQNILMCQRVMIAMAMSCEPELLIADEPTTALDVTIQAQILELMEDIRAKRNTGILMITH